MANLEALYARLPLALQNAACSIEGWRAQRFRFGGGYREIQRRVVDRNALPYEDFLALRDERLSAFIAHAATSVPFYRHRFTELDIDPREIRGLESLRMLPILTKADVQDQLEHFASRAVKPSDRRIVRTSGTTGGGLRFFTTRQAVQEQWATYWRYWRRHGITPEHWCAFFGGRSVVPANQIGPPFWRISLAQRRVLFSSHHLSSENIRFYVAELRRRAIPWIHGYPSLISLVAARLEESGEDIGYPVKWVTTGAENLLSHQKLMIERAFGVRPRQHYGSAEAVAQFSECSAGRLHVDEDFAAVELLPGDGDYGRIVGTNLSNLATPLIRYDIGDIGCVSAERCDCGLPGRIISEIDGRREDYVVRRDGAHVAALNHIFKDMVRVREAQLVQRVPGEVTVRVVKSESFTDEDERQLLQEAHKRLGDDTKIDVEYAQALPRTSTGKLRLVVSETGSVPGPAGNGHTS